MFSDFLSDLNASWRKPSYKKIKEVQHSVAMKMRKLVVNQLYGLEVCLIVDEMTNSEVVISTFSWLVTPLLVVETYQPLRALLLELRPFKTVPEFSSIWN